MRSASRPHPQPWGLLALLPAAAAAAAEVIIVRAPSALSLSNFQLITSSTTPVNCLLAYNQPLANCAIGDFTSSGDPGDVDGSTCSLACEAGILQTQQALQAVCGSAVALTAAPGSVLGVALTGNLVDFLCGGDSSAGTVGTESTGTGTDAGTDAGTDTSSVTAAAAADGSVATAATAATEDATVQQTLTTPPPDATAVPGLATTSPLALLTTSPVLSNVEAGGTAGTPTGGVGVGIAQAPAQSSAPPADDPLTATNSFVQFTSSLAAPPPLAPSTTNTIVVAPTTVSISTAGAQNDAQKATQATAKPTSSSSSSSGNTENAGNNANGGGSPFDAAVASGAAGAMAMRPWLVAAAAAIVGGVLLR